MENKTEFGIIEPKFPVRNLLVVPHRNEKLQVSYSAFGPDFFIKNIREMQKSYSHLTIGEKISFKEPTTSESISATAYDFGNLAKPEIFDSSWLQLGYIIKTSEGVFANPPKDSQGKTIMDEEILKNYLNKSKKINGIWLYNGKDARDFGFASYETFKQGVQECDSFAKSGLARLLEHTKEKTAGNLREIAPPKFYKRGVNVRGFDSVKEPILRVAGLVSIRGFDDYRLNVDGDIWDEDEDGFAFGVLK